MQRASRLSVVCLAAGGLLLSAAPVASASVHPVPASCLKAEVSGRDVLVTNHCFSKEYFRVKWTNAPAGACHVLLPQKSQAFRSPSVVSKFAGLVDCY